MTNRKFTPPTEFPTEYVDGYGDTVIIYGRGRGKYPLIGQYEDGELMQYDEAGHGGVLSEGDLHDLPKRITTWHNVYHYGVTGAKDGDSREYVDACAGDIARLCVYRIERDEDGGNPTITVETV